MRAQLHPLHSSFVAHCIISLPLDRPPTPRSGINFVNEKLQQIFIELTLKAEQDEYAAEGIPWKDIPYTNNKPLCDLIENKPGLLSICDDCCNTAKTDQMFVSDLKGYFSSNNNIQCGQNDFSVRHYGQSSRAPGCRGASESSRKTSGRGGSLLTNLVQLLLFVRLLPPAGDVRYQSDNFLTKVRPSRQRRERRGLLPGMREQLRGEVDEAAPVTSVLTPLLPRSSSLLCSSCRTKTPCSTI